VHCVNGLRYLECYNTTESMPLQAIDGPFTVTIVGRASIVVASLTGERTRIVLDDVHYTPTAVVNVVCGLNLPLHYNLIKPSIILVPLHKGKEAQQHEDIYNRSSNIT